MCVVLVILTMAGSADKESYGRVWLVVVCSVVNTVFTSGVIYGYPALYPALVDSKVYNELCVSGEDICKEQETRLTMLFTLSSSVAPFCNILVGLFMDKYGPRITGMLCAVVFLVGCVLFASSSESFDGYIPGFTLLGAAGPGMFMAGLTLGSRIPSQSGRIMSLHSCGFDASAIIFWFLDKLYFWTDYEATISILFWSYIVIPVYSFIVFFFLFKFKSELKEGAEDTSTEQALSFTEERKSLPTSGKKRQTISSAEYEGGVRKRSVASNLERAEDRGMGPGEQLRGDNTADTADTADEQTDLMNLTALQQMKTALFLLICSTVSISMLLLNFYIGTIPQQLKYLNDKESVDWMAQWFTVVMAFGAALSAPVVGFSLDKKGLVFSFYVTSCMLMSFQACTLIPYLQLQWFSVSLMTITRAFLYSAAGNLLGRAFGFKTFGKLYGIMMLCAGAVNFISIPLASLCINQLDGNFFYVNLSLLAFSASTFVLPVFMQKISFAAKTY